MRGLGVVFRQLSSMIQESPGGCSSAGFRQPSNVLPSNRSLNPACFSIGASVLSAALPVTQAAAAAAKKYLRFIAISPCFQGIPGRTHYISFATHHNFVGIAVWTGTYPTA